MVKIAIRADGGLSIGIGHIERCLILGRQLRRDGAKILFISRENNHIKEKIQNENFEIVVLQGNPGLAEDLQHTLNSIRAFGAEITITDSYEFDASYLRALAQASFLVTIDDLALIKMPADIIINQNLYARKLTYSTDGHSKLLLGPQFALLREEFADLKKRKIKPSVGNILVTLGGSDFLNLTPKILQILDLINRDFRITAILGFFFSNESGIRRIVRTMTKKIKLIRFTEELCKVLTLSDLAITGGGTTTYALAAAGTPAASFRFIGNQRENIRTLADYGTLIDLGSGTELNKLGETIIRIIDDFELRKKMSELGQELIDGRGTQRVSSVIQNEYFKRVKQS